MCFRDPQLVPVRVEELAPGDLVFFGTEEKIDHVGFWTGGGEVVQATQYGVPSTKETPWTSERLAPALPLRPAPRRAPRRARAPPA